MGLRIFTTYEEYSATLSRLHRLIGEVEDTIDVVKENHNSARVYMQGGERNERVRWFPGCLDAQIAEIQESVNALKILSRDAKYNREQQRKAEENSVDE
tara:strand:- start:6251 stop:6547 length:297 start_codon:yes stop_codon:yes gene_type:complete